VQTGKQRLPSSDEEGRRVSGGGGAEHSVVLRRKCSGGLRPRLEHSQEWLCHKPSIGDRRYRCRPCGARRANRFVRALSHGWLAVGYMMAPALRAGGSRPRWKPAAPKRAALA
jgi:hypothetical protein